MAERWNPDDIIAWLVTEGRFLPDEDALIGALGAKMLAAGAPVWRIRLTMRTLHPLLAAISEVWERDEGLLEAIEIPHGIRSRSTYIGSPFEQIMERDEPLHMPLEGPLPDDAHIALVELKERGATDYYGLRVPFSDGGAGIFATASDTKGGFTTADLAAINRLTAVMAPIVEVFRARREARAVATAYLGESTGKRVLEGQITRGHIETIDAAVLVSDLRGWSDISSGRSPEDALALVNRYFEIVVGAVEAEGGEVLKFIGDGILAVFPGEGGGAASRRALAAAIAAQSVEFEAEFGVAVHRGEVLYGNVGAEKRLDFTVMGESVNLTARVEDLCSQLDEPILFTQRVNDAADIPTRAMGKFQVKGIERDVALFAPDIAIGPSRTA